MAEAFTDLSLDGRIAVVTGGGRGIGLAISERLAAAGAHVILTWTHAEPTAVQAAGRIVAAGGRAEPRRLDVRDGEAVDAFFAAVERDHGRVDVLVNNAGVVRDGLVVSLTDEDWLDVLQTNLLGAARCIRAAARPMMLQRKGAIINLSSVAAARPNRGQPNYAASKGGIEALTRQVAVELGRKNVRVNAVAPGVIETEMSQRVRDEAGDDIKKRTILRRFGQPQEVASLVHFLASDAAAYVTGQVWTVDGGLGLG